MKSKVLLKWIILWIYFIIRKTHKPFYCMILRSRDLLFLLLHFKEWIISWDLCEEHGTFPVCQGLSLKRNCLYNTLANNYKNTFIFCYSDVPFLDFILAEYMRRTKRIGVKKCVVTTRTNVGESQPRHHSPLVEGI